MYELHIKYYLYDFLITKMKSEFTIYIVYITNINLPLHLILSVVFFFYIM